MPILKRFQSAWNAFFNRDPTSDYQYMGQTFSYKPDRIRLTRGNERSIITSVFNRIALDVASIDIKHIQTDENGRYLKEMPTRLNDCLTLSTNRDQTALAFKVDLIMSLFDEGVIALVPTDTESNPLIGPFDISSIRVAKITSWKPTHVEVRVYNENTGLYEDLLLPKDILCIIENPLYSIMNEPNSTLQRLIRKLNLLDAIDEQSGAGKLDLIIQFPQTIRTEQQKIRADQRRREIERQLAGSKYGIAYADGTEKIVQLNRSLDNNLMSQIEYLTNQLFNQLGMSQEIFDGTANEQVMLNYYNRTIEPLLSAIVLEMRRKWLSTNARTRGQTIAYFREPFKLVPTAQLAELADKFTRNEIMTSNEIRQVIGMKPSDDPHADELRNSNLSHPAEEDMTRSPEFTKAMMEEIQNDS